MSQPALFEPLAIGALTLPNRIIVAPMCQYAAPGGVAGAWHDVHLGTLALSGAGLVIIEACAVEARGRITPSDLALYTEEQERALWRALATAREVAPRCAIGIQLAHAGRKASRDLPWRGGALLRPDEGGWVPRAPSPAPYDRPDPAPEALSESAIGEIVAAFARAAERAVRCGVDLIEIHAAHGYLLHSFLSPLSNRREDRWGVDESGRALLALEILDAVRGAVAGAVPVGVRLSATDWAPGGWEIEACVRLARALEERGAEYIHVSSGGLTPEQSIPIGPGYQIPLARAVRAEASVPIIGVGLVTEPEHAEAIVAAGDADAVAIARAILWDPRWPWHAAAALGASIEAPGSYLRAEPRGARGTLRALNRE